MKRNDKGKMNIQDLATKNLFQTTNIFELIENVMQIKILNVLRTGKKKMYELVKLTELTKQEINRQLVKMIENQLVMAVLIDVAYPTKFFYLLTEDGMALSEAFAGITLFADNNILLTQRIFEDIRIAQNLKYGNK